MANNAGARAGGGGANGQMNEHVEFTVKVSRVENQTGVTQAKVRRFLVVFLHSLYLHFYTLLLYIIFIIITG
jgi:hypothetical protein